MAPFIEAAEHVRCARIYSPDMSELRVTTFDGVDCRWEFQCVLPQYETKRILETHLVSLGGTVEREVTATRLEAGREQQTMSERKKIELYGDIGKCLGNPPFLLHWFGFIHWHF